MNHLVRNRHTSLLTMLIKRNSSARPDNDPLLKSRDNLPIIKVPKFNRGNIKKLKRSITIENILHDRKQIFRAVAAKAKSKSAAAMTNLVQKRNLTEFPNASVTYDQPPPSDHVIILPEEIHGLGSDEILRLPKRGEPELDFSKFDIESVYKGVSKLILSFEYYCADYNNGIESKSETIGQLFRSIEEHLYPAESAVSIMMILATLDPDNYRHPAISQLMERYYRARNERTKGAFCDSLEGFIARDREKFGPTERKMLYYYNMPNIERPKMKNLEGVTLNMSREHLQGELLIFQKNVYQTNANFSHTVDDPDILSTMSNDLDECLDLHHKERTPFQVSVSTYKKFMQVCPDRFVRQMLWQTYNKRCSPKGPVHLNNMDSIKSIRSLYRGIADKIGYRTHAEYRRQDSIAKSRQEIVENFEHLNAENMPKLIAELTELNDFASDNKFYDPRRIGIQEYDLEYWMQKYIYEIIIGCNERDLKMLFPLQTVMRGMQKFFKQYHGIELNTQSVENAHGLTKQNNWANSLHYIDVLNETKTPLGTIIFDPFYRRGKSMNEMLYCQLRNYNKQSDCLPSRLISASFKPDPTTQKAYLGLSEVVDMFKYFSVAIQHLMYRYDYIELNHHGMLEVEAKDLFPQLCLAQLLTDHKILQTCSERGDSKPIDAELANRILKAKAFTKPFKTWHDLYIAHFDLEVHTRLDDVHKIAEEIYTIYSPFQRDPDNYDYCAMTSIFIGPGDGIHYGKLWSKQLANFCLQNGPPRTADLESRRDYNVKLRQSLFAPDKFDTNEKLFSLTGRHFKFSETGLSVL